MVQTINPAFRFATCWAANTTPRGVLVPKARSTRSPGWSEAEPWERNAFGDQSPETGDANRTDTAPIRGLKNAFDNRDPAFRPPAADYMLGCEYNAALRLKRYYF